MFPPPNDQHVAAREEEELRWLFALLTTKLWVTSFWFGAKMSSGAVDVIVVLLAGIQLVQWMLHLFRLADRVWDWFCLTREQREQMQLRLLKSDLEIAKTVAERRRAKTKNEADRADIDMELQALQSQLARVKERLDDCEARDKEAEREEH